MNLTTTRLTIEIVKPSQLSTILNGLASNLTLKQYLESRPQRVNLNKLEKTLTQASRQWGKIEILAKELENVGAVLQDMSKQNHIINPYLNVTPSK